MNQDLHEIWSPFPAHRWEEAYPIGNGRLGAMVFGQPDTERVQLNEESVWSGTRHYNPNPLTRSNLEEVRRLLFTGQQAEALALAGQTMTMPNDPRYGAYQPLGDLDIEWSWPGAEPGGDQTYRRRLLLGEGLVHIAAPDPRGGLFTREYLSSAVDQVIAIRCCTTHPRGLTFRLGLSRPQTIPTARHGEEALLLQGTCPHGGVSFAALAEVDVIGMPRGAGFRLETDENGRTILQVNGAPSCVLYLAAATTFRTPDPVQRAAEMLSAARAKGWSTVRADHIADYRRLFDPCTLRLGSVDDARAAATIPTAMRLGHLEKAHDPVRAESHGAVEKEVTAPDPALAALYFHYGRYLLISSSRPGCLPANLQGIWNESFTPPWFSDFTLNINLQMNYWPAWPTNLGELCEPLYRLIEDLREPGERTAAERYGCRGMVLGIRTNPWFDTSLRSMSHLLWQEGAAWLSRHLWEHWEYSGDRAFLRDRAWPILASCARFYLDFLVQDPRTGHLVSGPSSSPENHYRTGDGKKAALDMGPAMAQSIIHDLFTNLGAAATVLGDELPPEGRALADEVSAARSRLAPLRVGEHGRLLEWSEDFTEADPGHRHISHLYALHPGEQITPRGTPHLARAARASLERRLKGGGGHTGWSCAWLINHWARLGDGEASNGFIQRLFTHSTYPNLLCVHPPFQIDGNFGGTAGIVEMLLQSHAGEIHLLPALPASWSEGSVEGLLARGGVTVSMEWKGGALVRTRLLSRGAVILKLRYRQPLTFLDERSGLPLPTEKVQPSDDGATVLNLEADSAVVAVRSI